MASHISGVAAANHYLESKRGNPWRLQAPLSSQDRRVQCYLQYRYTVCTYTHVSYRFMQVGYLWVILRQSGYTLTRASMTDFLYRGLCKDSMILYSVQVQNKTVRLYLQLPRLYPWCITLAVSRFSQMQLCDPLPHMHSTYISTCLSPGYINT